MQFRLAAAKYTSETMIEPEVGRFGWFDFPKVTEIVDEGYRAYRRIFPHDLVAPAGTTPPAL